MAISLNVSGLDAGYGTVKILHQVSVDVPMGRTVALMGTNGNGKSTLIKAILGLVRATAGRITLTIDGAAHDLTKLSTEAIVDLGIGVVPEGRRLFGALTVEENLNIGSARRAARSLHRQNLDFVFETFPILAERRGQRVGTMSGGQQQMVAIGRALMTQPRLLIVDEPSVGLAPNIVQQTIAQIRDLKENRNLTVLMAEQNFNQAISIADRAYVIANGRIVLSSDDMAGFANSDTVRNIYLGVGEETEFV